VATDGPVIPVDEFDRGTPRRSAEGFLTLADASDLETAAEYLDLRNLRGEASELTGAQLARRLYVIVKRATWRPQQRQPARLPGFDRCHFA